MHGILKKHLFGSALSICDRLVIDDEWNLHVGNVNAGNVCATLLSTDIIEKDPTEGIRFFGNINLQEGFFLTGNVNLSGVMFNDFFTSGNVTAGGNVNAPIVCADEMAVDCIYGKGLPGNGPLIKGATEIDGTLDIVGGPLTVPQIFSSGVCSDVVLLDTLTPKSADEIQVLQGNLAMCGGAIHANLICSKNPGQPVEVCNGGLRVLDGCFTLHKETAGPSVGPITTTAPAGVIIMQASGSIAMGGTQTVRLMNPCISADSVVMASIGSYISSGVPAVIRVEVNSGFADIVVQNLWHAPLSVSNDIPNLAQVPIQYLIV